MIDLSTFSDLAAQLGTLTGIKPATLVLYIFVIVKLADMGARLIPNDATGFLGVVRKLCAIIGGYVSSRVTGGTTVNEVAAAALKTPPIPEVVEETKEESK